MKRTLVFWIWNDEPDPAEIRRQIREFHRQGVEGFFVHPMPAEFRAKDFPGGMKGYLSDRYFEMFGVAVACAQELDMEAWIYDEGGWPSGTVNGRLPREYPELRLQTIQPTGEILPVPQRPDLLNRKVTELFLSMVHEEYRKRFAPHFGKTIPGVFTDEPYFGFFNPKSDLPWSPVLAERFSEIKHYDAKDAVMRIFHENDPQARQDYCEVWNRLMAENFLMPVREWCHANNLLFTGHFNGGLHTLSNLHAEGGLFGYIGQGSTISDLLVEDAAIDMSGAPVGGVVCAHADHSTIDHCRVMGAVSFYNLPNSATYMGGIVGEATALSRENSHIRNCHFAASVTLTGSSVAHRLGGIAGHLVNSMVTNSYTQVLDASASQATMTIGNAYAGGIVGRCDGMSHITNCYYGIYDNVSGTEGHFGDICGEVGSSTHITYAYYHHTIAALDNATEGYIQNVYPYDLNEGEAVYTINGQHLSLRLNSVSTTLGALAWSNPGTATQAPQLSI